MSFSRLFLAAGLSLLVTLSVRSAEFSSYSEGVPSETYDGLVAAVIELDGELRRGDALKLRSQLRKFPESETIDSGVYPILRLNSPGGDYTEGMKLVRLIRDWGITTYVGPGDRCLSACALVFMAGTQHVIESPSVTARFLHVGGELGFHAPYDPGGTREFTAGVIAIADLFAALGPMDADLYYNMLVTPDEEFVYADTIYRAGRWGIGLVGAKNPEIDLAYYWNVCSNRYNWSEPPTDEKYPSAREGWANDLSLEDLLILTSDPEYTGSTRAVPLPASAPGMGHAFSMMFDEMNGVGCDALTLSSDGYPTITQATDLEELGPILPDIDWRYLGSNVPAWHGYDPSLKLRDVPRAEAQNPFNVMIDGEYSWPELLFGEERG